MSFVAFLLGLRGASARLESALPVSSVFAGGPDNSGYQCAPLQVFVPTLTFSTERPALGALTETRYSGRFPLSRTGNLAPVP